MALAVGVIKASLPSYFPDRHGVFDAALSAIAELAEATGARVVEAPGVPMNGPEAQVAVDHCRPTGRSSSCWCTAASPWATWRARSP